MCSTTIATRKKKFRKRIVKRERKKEKLKQKKEEKRLLCESVLVVKLFIVIVRAKNAAKNFSLDEIVVCIFICYANPNYRYYYIELGNFIVVIFFFLFSSCKH